MGACGESKKWRPCMGRMGVRHMGEWGCDIWEKVMYGENGGVTYGV